MLSKNRSAFARLPSHTVNADRGAVSLWLCPPDDLNTRTTPEWVKRYFPNADVYPLLSDIPDARDRWSAKFIWQWDTGWYPQFYAKFDDGPIYANPNNPKHLTCAIDGEVVLEATDSPDTNNGPICTSGRIAIRCMRATNMVFRNLKIWVRPTGVKTVGSIRAK